MRHPVHTFLVIFLIAAPACAQAQSSSPQQGRQAASQAQDQAAKTSPPQGTDQTKTATDPAPQSTQDNSMADFNVLGSTAQAAFGHDGP